MPQLDQVTYFSQFFWLCLFYFTFYVFLVKLFLPKISRILKVRNKKMSDGSNIVVSDQESHSYTISQEYNDVLTFGIQQAYSALNQSVIKNTKTLNIFFNKVNQESLQSANKQYIMSILNSEASSSLLERDFAIFSKKEIQENREKVGLLYDQKILNLLGKYSNMKK